MQRIFTYFNNRRERLLAAYLTRYGKVITVLVQESQMQDDLAHAPIPEQRYLHRISATWTDPTSGRAYLFHREFRSLRAIPCRIGDMVQVLIDPRNYRRYLMHGI